MMSKRTVWLFTGGFPFSNGETHIESEIVILSKEFERIYLIPPVNFKKHRVRDLPANVEVITISNDWGSKKLGILFKNISFIMSVISLELRETHNRKALLKNFRELLSMFIQRIYEADELERIIKEKNEKDPVFYSYWFSDWSTVMAILKQRRVIRSFVTRAHRFDVYEHLALKDFIPFRHFQLKMIDMVLTDSQKAADFMIANTRYPEKISCSYYGSFDHGINPFDEKSVFKIVSCSTLIPRKRVNLIVKILGYLDFPVHWVHFGDGPMFEEIRNEAAKLPSTVKVEFKGHVSNKDVLDYYATQSVNLMMLISDSEGVPMSLIEACSFGIPMLTCDAGGNNEIVNASTGILVPEDLDPVKVAELIKRFRSGNENTPAFRIGVRNYWNDHFNGDTNYLKFCEIIRSV